MKEKPPTRKEEVISCMNTPENKCQGKNDKTSISTKYTM